MQIPRGSQTVQRLLVSWRLQSTEVLDSQQASACLATSQRCLATTSQGAPSQPQPSQPQSAESHAAKLAYSKNLRQLRKTWQEQHAEKLATKAKADAIKNANKAKSVEAHRRNVSVMKELRIQIDMEKRRLQMAELVSLVPLVSLWFPACIQLLLLLLEKYHYHMISEASMVLLSIIAVVFAKSFASAQQCIPVDSLQTAQQPICIAVAAQVCLTVTLTFILCAGTTAS